MVTYSFCCSVTQLCPTLWDPMNHTTSGFPILHHLLELAQTHIHWVGDAIQPPHHLSSLSPPAFSLSQCQALFQWVSSSYQVARILELKLQHRSFQWIFRTDFLYNWFISSPCSLWDSEKSSLTPQCKSISPLVLGLLYGPTLTTTHDYWRNHSFD